MDLVDVAINAGNFKKLVAAAQAGELVDTLKSAGPFTVFAPTDEAFQAVPSDTLDRIMKDKNRLGRFYFTTLLMVKLHLRKQRG